mmetsp:Transcript_21688/g.34733  ORF Transcript_21688/g.34733 Transcript_21688/m.34733 type:complete len:105 (+) Transcript_21688:1562-1876(+)
MNNNINNNNNSRSSSRIASVLCRYIMCLDYNRTTTTNNNNNNNLRDLPTLWYVSCSVVVEFDKEGNGLAQGKRNCATTCKEEFRISCEEDHNNNNNNDRRAELE